MVSFSDSQNRLFYSLMLDDIADVQSDIRDSSPDVVVIPDAVSDSNFPPPTSVRKRRREQVTSSRKSTRISGRKPSTAPKVLKVAVEPASTTPTPTRALILTLVVDVDFFRTYGLGVVENLFCSQGWTSLLYATPKVNPIDLHSFYISIMWLTIKRSSLGHLTLALKHTYSRVKTWLNGWGL